MGLTFGSYGIAYSGMNVSQAALAATSNNLANVNTAGASRVRVAGAEQTINLVTGSVGAGVDVAAITRTRDRFLDNSYRTQNAQASYWSVKSGNLEYMEELLAEFTADDGTSGDGVQQLFADFFDSWQELAKDPTSLTNRQAVIESANSLISAVAVLDAQLVELQQDAYNGFVDGVDSLNDLASQVAALNQQIAAAEADGSEASYFRDQRDTLIDQMSALTNISVTESGGMVSVWIGGVALVDGTTTYKLIVGGNGTDANPYQVKWSGLDCQAEIATGSIKAYLEDASQTGYSVIAESELPFDFTAGAASSITNLRQALNSMLITIVYQINGLHAAGYGLDGSTGLAYFTAIDANEPLSLSNIQVNSELAANLNKIAAGSTTELGDNSIATSIYDLQDGQYYKFDGIAQDFTGFYASLIAWLGNTSAAAAGNYETQMALVTQIDNQRQAIGGISIDEEMSNMIMYQNAYAASARVMSTLDSLVEDLLAIF